jgi:hypothetical protein
MKPPICRICLAEDLVRIAKTIEMPDRGVLVTAAADMRMRKGCVHLAEEGEGQLSGMWFWSACGKRSDHHSTCSNPEHVNCGQCRARRKLDEKDSTRLTDEAVNSGSCNDGELGQKCDQS